MEAGRRIAARPWLGPCVTLLALALSEGLGRGVLGVDAPLMVPSILGVAAMVFAVFSGGLGPGLVSAGLVFGVSAWHLTAGPATLASPAVALRLAALVVALPAMVALTWGLKRQAIAGARADAERAAAVAHAEKLQAANEELTVQAEELQSQQEELEELTDSLRVAHNRLEGILDHAPEAIVTLDESARIADLNPAAEQLFGVTAAGVTGHLAHEVLLGPASGEAWQQAFSRLREDGGAVTGLELVGRRADGAQLVLEVALTCVEASGTSVFTAFMRDLTRQRRAEEAGRQLDALLRTEALKDQFLAVLSHELRTPINAVTGFGSILQDELAGPLNHEQRLYLGKMLEATDALLRLVDDLLDMSRIQAGMFEVAVAPMRLGPVAEQVVETLRPLADRKSLRVAVEVADDLPVLQADGDRVSQVLLNLLGNAIKFTPPGGHIAVGACRDGDGVRAEVRDDGPGIAPEDQPKLFHRFSQLDMSATRQVGGVGLGLSICKALVEAHGGRIGVESRVSQGSTFWFWLPLEAVRVGRSAEA